MSAAGRCTAAAATCLTVLCGLPGTVAQAVPPPPALPEGLVWVTRGPQETGSTLHRAGAGGTVTAVALRYALNAIGCTRERVVLGLATGRAGAALTGGPHLVRVEDTGGVVDLGALPGKGSPLTDGYGGTVVTTPDGVVELLVGTRRAMRPVRVAPGPPVLLAPRPLPVLPYAGDWAVEPGSGDLLTVVGRAGRATLVRLAPGAAAPVYTTLPAALPPSSAWGGVALGADGTLYALFNAAAGPGAGAGTGRAPAGGALYRIALRAPDAAVKVADVGAVVSSDAAMCPAQPTAPVRVAAVPPPPAAASPSRTASRAPSAAPSVKLPAKLPGTPSVVVSRRPPRPAPLPVASGAAPPVPAPVRVHRPRPVAAVAPLPRKARIPLRYVPVVGGLLMVAVAMTRLTRRRR